MKHFLLFVFLFACLACRSQVITYGSLYNYSVGDTIVTMYVHHINQSSSTPPKVTYRMFTHKSYSPNMDTIYYKANEVIAQYSQCICSPVVLSSGTVAFSVTNLTQSAVS